MKKLIYIFSFLFLLSSFSFCLDENGFTATGWVNDFAGIIDASNTAKLTSLIGEVKEKTGAEIAVVTIKSLKGDNIDDFSNRLFTHWGIGKKGDDNGVLLLVAVSDRKIRIEVGYGLESLLPDSFAGETIRDIITPQFKDGQYGAGILAGVIAISERIADYYKITLTGNYSPENVQNTNYSKPSLFHIVVMIIFFIIMLILFIRHPALFMLFFFSGGFGGGGGYGGGFGGGFGGFGGGSSGGGGASGGW